MFKENMENFFIIKLAEECAKEVYISNVYMDIFLISYMLLKFSLSLILLII